MRTGGTPLSGNLQSDQSVFDGFCYLSIIIFRLFLSFSEQDDLLVRFLSQSAGER